MRRIATVRGKFDPHTSKARADVMYEHGNAEYIVKLYGPNNEHSADTDYYTSDREDAVGTAEFMVNQMWEKQNAQ